MGTISSFPTALQALIQTSFLERLAREGLDSTVAFRLVADEEPMPPRLGETITKTRSGRKAPVTTPLSVTSSNSLDDNLSPSANAVEQFTATMQPYGDSVDTNLFQDLVGLTSQIIMNSRNNAVQAGQSLERIAKKNLYGAYLGGNTRIRTDYSGAVSPTTTTSCSLDDIRGFQYVFVNGTLTAVSGGNTLTATEAGTTAQTLTISAVTADGTNHSTAPDGISGSITFTASSGAPTAGDSLIASTAPVILRPRGTKSTGSITAGDSLTLGLILDAVAGLRDNSTPPRSDGNFHCLLDNTTQRELFGDQQFIVAYAGRYQSREYQEGDIIRLMGTTFVPTTESYIQAANSGAGVSVKVRRAIVVGSGAMLEVGFGGLESFMRQSPVNAISDIVVVNNVAHIIRPALDRLGQWLAMTWFWAGDFPIPTDSTATTSIIPTVDSAYYKRARVIEVAG